MYFPYGGAECSSIHYEVLVEVNAPRSQWIQSTVHSPCPVGAHCAGNDSDGTPMYIGRAFHAGDQLPAKVLPNKQAAYVSYGGAEILKHHYEILCHGNVQWVPSSYGSVPPNAVPGGRTSSGETLYIGRAPYMGSITVGKVQPSHQTLYIPYNGSEIPIKGYEILTEV